MANKKELQNRESVERQRESRATDKYGAGPGSSGPGQVRVHSHTPENRTGELNPSAPTESTEGPSTNLANDPARRATDLGTTRGEPAQGEEKTNDGAIKKPFEDKHDAA
jgi:hypothetical protein